MCSMVLTLIACTKTESGSSAPAGGLSSGSSITASDSTAGSAQAALVSTGPSDGADEVAQLVMHDVGSKALGNQKIDAGCVAVTIMPSGDWTVATARLKGCGDKTARSILWVYKRNNGKWSEDYVGQPPRCWKGVPLDIAGAVTKATRIPSC